MTSEERQQLALDSIRRLAEALFFSKDSILPSINASGEPPFYPAEQRRTLALSNMGYVIQARGNAPDYITLGKLHLAWGDDEDVDSSERIRHYDLAIWAYSRAIELSNGSRDVPHPSQLRHCFFQRGYARKFSADLQPRNEHTLSLIQQLYFSALDDFCASEGSQLVDARSALWQGHTYYDLAYVTTTPDLSLLARSAEHYLEYTSLNPKDAEGFYCVGTTYEALADLEGICQTPLAQELLADALLNLQEGIMIDPNYDDIKTRAVSLERKLRLSHS